MIGIYKIVNPKGRVYIGQSVNIEKRWEDYARTLAKGQTRLCRSIKRYGLLQHILEVVEECSEEDLNIRERYWQDHFQVISRKGMNCRLTGSNDKTGYLSEETKQKISKAHRGKIVSQETRQRISEVNRGKKLSEETCRRMSIAKKGVVFTDQHLANLKKPRKRIICPHCKKEGGAAQMKQWHFDRCKNK